MNNLSYLNLVFSLSILFLSTACSMIPPGVEVETNFEKEKYLGKWYEIARIDFKYEKDLNNTTAHYSKLPNGTIKVVNRGYNTKEKVWQEAIGKAKFVDSERLGQLKVSFFGPFYAGYNILSVDNDYQYALVGGGKFNYLWILARKPEIPEEIKNHYLEIADQFGYHVKDLIWINHNQE